MTLESKNTTPSEEDYGRAMNTIGQNLVSALAQTVEKLEPELRNLNVISQALAAFLANVIYKHFPQDSESRVQMLSDIGKFVQLHLDSMMSIKDF